jgi:hypothetical protein
MKLNHFTAFILITLAATLTASCSKMRTVRQKPELHVTQMDPGLAMCICPGAVKYQVSNTGPVAGKLNGSRMTRIVTSPESAIENQPVSLIVQPNKTIALECSIKADALKTCSTSVAYELGGISYPSPIADLSRDLVIKTVQAHTAPFDGDLSPNNSCLSACVGNGGSCLTFDASNSTDVQLGRSIALLMGNLSADATITNQKIMELTKSGVNECSRTDVAFRDGSGYNFGNQCEVQGILPGGNGDVDVMIPASFVTTYNQLGGGNFDMKFYKSKAAPQIVFSKPDLQATYGGSIKQINFQQDKFIAQTGLEKCFAIKIK